jgi:hypothetical protein
LTIVETGYVFRSELILAMRKAGTATAQASAAR